MAEKNQYQREEKNEAGEIVISNPFLKWLDNFWYHHKWKTIIISFFSIVFIVCFTQCITKEDVDMNVTFAGSYTMTEQEAKSIKDVLSTLADQKTSMGEGKDTLPKVNILSYPVYTEQELLSMYTDEKGIKNEYSYLSAVNRNQDRLTTFGTYVMTGECSVWFVNEFVYEQQNLGSKLGVKIADTFGESHNLKTHDEYAIRLGDTAFYQHYSAMQILPEDTLIVLTKSFVMGASSNEAFYRQCVELYRAIVEFEAPQ